MSTARTMVDLWEMYVVAGPARRPRRTRDDRSSGSRCSKPHYCSLHWQNSMKLAPIVKADNEGTGAVIGACRHFPSSIGFSSSIPVQDHSSSDHLPFSGHPVTMMISEDLRVQALVEQGLTEVPKQFLEKFEELRDSEDASSPAAAAEQVPVIDLAGWPNRNRENIVEDVGEAFETWGLFQVINHGVPLNLLHRTKERCKLFFVQPSEQKMKYANKFSPDTASVVPEGYGSKLVHTDDTVWNWRDYFEHHTLPLSRLNPLLWPAEPEFYRATIEEYGGEIKRLAETLLGILSEHLRLPATRLQEAVGVSGVYQNVNFGCYPPCPQPESVLGFFQHTDYGAVAILWENEVHGLQVRKNGAWVTVETTHLGALIINAGDALEVRDDRLIDT